MWCLHFVCGPGLMFMSDVSRHFVQEGTGSIPEVSRYEEAIIILKYGHTQREELREYYIRYKIHPTNSLTCAYHCS